MYNEHHAQTLSREMAVQNVKEFASSAISSDGSFQVKTADQLYFWGGDTKRARDALGERMGGCLFITNFWFYLNLSFGP